MESDNNENNLHVVIGQLDRERLHGLLSAGGEGEEKDVKGTSLPSTS